MLTRYDLDWNDSPEAAHRLSCELCRMPVDTAFDMFSGGSGASAANSAAAAQVQGANQAMQIQEQAYREAGQNLQPGVQAYARTTPYLAGMLGIPGYDQVDPTQALRSTPGYQWGMDQGVSALDKSAASRGNLYSGAQGKGLTQFGQGLADQTYNQYTNNLMQMMNSGQGAAGQLSQFGANMANQIGNYDMYSGNSKAQGIMNAYNANQQGGNVLGSLLGMGLGIGMAPMTGGTSLIGSGMSALGNLFGGAGGGGGGTNPFSYTDIGASYNPAYY